MKGAPARTPCVSCPYRRDVPSGVWVEEEYEKLPRYDGPTAEQPPSAFFCHQRNGRLCSGWCGTHDMEESLALRFAVIAGTIDQEAYEAAVDYESPVPLWDSGEEAARHGMERVADPDEFARVIIDKTQRKRERRRRT